VDALELAVDRRILPVDPLELRVRHRDVLAQEAQLERRQARPEIGAGRPSVSCGASLLPARAELFGSRLRSRDAPFACGLDVRGRRLVALELYGPFRAKAVSIAVVREGPEACTRASARAVARHGQRS
jgi:hypothetical protein